MKTYSWLLPPMKACGISRLVPTSLQSLPREVTLCFLFCVCKSPSASFVYEMALRGHQQKIQNYPRSSQSVTSSHLQRPHLPWKINDKFPGLRCVYILGTIVNLLQLFSLLISRSQLSFASSTATTPLLAGLSTNTANIMVLS